jgi:hypothetical protein
LQVRLLLQSRLVKQALDPETRYARNRCALMTVAIQLYLGTGGSVPRAC